MTDLPPLDLRAILAHDGPLPRATALAALDHAAALMASADWADAGRLYQRIIGFDDPAVTAAAMLGLGEAFIRLDDERAAVSTWEEITRLPETPALYPAWRNLAAARVRAGDLRGAVAAYREADRRAPAADKAEIASRLGWLSKELGDRGAAGRYFSKARGDAGFSFAVILVAVTVAVSLIADFGINADLGLYELLALDKPAVATGEVWRLWTVTLVHARLTEMPLHLLFNMYLLYQTGPFVERLYGRLPFLLMYVVFAAGGSLASFAFSDGSYSVGASGAIFGLFGLLLAVQVIHRPMLDRGSRAFLGQMGSLIAINLVFGFLIPSVDNWAHIGGLVAGLWVGFLFAPTRVPTMRSMWFRPGATSAPSGVTPGAPSGPAELILGGTGTRLARTVGMIALGVFLLVLWTLGVAAWS